MKGNIYIYVVLSQQDTLLSHQQIKFQKHCFTVLPQRKLMSHLFPANHISSLSIRVTQSFIT